MEEAVVGMALGYASATRQPGVTALCH